LRKARCAVRTVWSRNEGSVIMNRNHIQFVILTLGFVLSGAVAAADYAGGAGEPNDPYLIATTEQLLGAEFWQPGVHYRLCNDIDLAGETVWTSRELNGHLDGGGYSIRHATIGSSRYFQAFFAEVSREATITNLALVDFTVAVPDDDTRQVSYVGGLVAANAGAIANCAATGGL